jgi:hypothetical protein
LLQPNQTTLDLIQCGAKMLNACQCHAWLQPTIHDLAKLASKVMQMTGEEGLPRIHPTKAFAPRCDKEVPRPAFVCSRE